MSEIEAYPEIDPSLYSGPFLPARQGASPLGSEGSLSQIPLTQKGKGLGDGASLVQYISITYKQPNFPSDIAREALDNIYLCEREQPICSNFVEYLDQCEQKGFMLKGYDHTKISVTDRKTWDDNKKVWNIDKIKKTGGIINIPLSYGNRWSPNRRRELSEKLKRLEFWFEEQEDRPVTMITLTSYHEGLSVSSAWHELNKSRGKLLKLISFYFPHFKKWVIDDDGYLSMKLTGPDYFWVPEPHKSGYAHYHLAVFDAIDNKRKDKITVKGKNKGEGIEDKFRKLWSRKYKTGNHTYGLDFSQKKGDGKIQHLKDYLSKYLAKGFLLDKWTRGMLIFNANLWETGFRMYGASTAIRKMMNIEPDKPSQIVWLETKMQSPEITPEGETIEIEKVIWYRQYIPDWIDSDFWLTPEGWIAPSDPPPKYIHDWGRPASYHAQEYKVTSYRDTEQFKKFMEKRSEQK
jgi:hypothetical protein